MSRFPRRPSASMRQLRRATWPALRPCFTARLPTCNCKSTVGITPGAHFSFFDSSGTAIAPGNITVAAASTFQQYFAGSTLAGVFGLHALFPVNGDSNQVVAALVQITNSVGTVESEKITF